VGRGSGLDNRAEPFQLARVSNTPPRVPPGWSRAAAAFVWRDWLDCLTGFPRPALVNGWGIDPISQIPGLVLIEIRAWNEDGDMYRPSWETPEARLRAWAAVGAPVIPPVGDGKHSMLEWFAAAQSSALGPSVECVGYGGDNEMVLHWSVLGMDIAEAFLTLTRQCTVESGGSGEVVVNTPVEMVAELDRIAGDRAWVLDSISE